MEKTTDPEKDGPGVRKCKWSTQDRFRMNRKSGRYGIEYPRPFLSKRMDQESENSNGIPKTVFVETDGQESGHV